MSKPIKPTWHIKLNGTPFIKLKFCDITELNDTFADFQPDDAKRAQTPRDARYLLDSTATTQ